MSEIRQAMPFIENGQPVITVNDLHKWFPVRRGLFDTFFSREEPTFVHAVDGVSFSVAAGETLAIVGESGSGKTTVGMTILRLYEPTSGNISFTGKDITHITGKELHKFRRVAQIIFQNPYESLNPRFNVYDTVAEPLRLHKIGTVQEQQFLVKQALERAELIPGESLFWHYPHALSGGQRQRLAIARAIVLEPALLVADEPVSMLDVSIRAGVLNLLKRLNNELGTAMLYISHDLTTVRYISRRTITMYAGQIVEMGETEVVIGRPYHPYTQLLIKAIPRTDRKASRQRVLLKGEVPNLIRPPAGCRFHPRCPFAAERCEHEVPPLLEVEPGHFSACHFPERAGEFRQRLGEEMRLREQADTVRGAHRDG
jgi:peptide/nickel transport system ATP-binding protein